MIAFALFSEMVLAGLTVLGMVTTDRSSMDFSKPRK